MNDIRRTILWVIFGFALVLLWDKWQMHNGKQATFFPTPASAVATAPAQPQPASQSVTGGASAVPSAVPAAVGAAEGASGVPTTTQAVAAVPAPAREQVVLTTDVLRLTFDSEGGSLTQAELLKYVDMADKSRNFVLFDQSTERV